MNATTFLGAAAGCSNTHISPSRALRLTNGTADGRSASASSAAGWLISVDNQIGWQACDSVGELVDRLVSLSNHRRESAVAITFFMIKFQLK
jgi:hypothetical protein